MQQFKSGKMSVHDTKRTAILQWYNSFSSSDLSTLGQLADGQYFCDIISSVFCRDLDLPANECPADVDIKIETDPISDDAGLEKEIVPVSNEIDNTETSPIPIDVDLKFETDVDIKIKSEPDVDIKIKSEPCGFDIDTNSETEPYPFEIDTTVESEADIIEKEVKYIQQELSKVLVNNSDALKEVNHVEGESGDCKEEKFDGIEDMYGDNKVPVIDETKSDVENVIKETESVVAVKHEFSHAEIIGQRYDFVQEFINEMYNINSEDLVDYLGCSNCVEIELAKVGILILSLIVKHFLETDKNDQLNTLTHLDQEVQEDIQECLSIILKDKISRKDIERILTKAARYKATPRKSLRVASTPARSCSSRYKDSVHMLTTSNEDVYSDSPLKSFLESPQFKKVLVSKDKELVKARKAIHAEEIRSEELEVVVNNLKRKIEEKDKVVKKLKRDVKTVKNILELKEEEMQECNTCADLKIQLKQANSCIKEQKEECVIKEEENCELQHQLTMMQGKILRRQTVESFAHLPENVKKIIEDKEEEIKSLSILNKNLKSHVEQLQEVFNTSHTSMESKVHNVNNETEKEDSLMPTSSPVAGECIGAIIEDDNRMLRNKLLKAQDTIDMLLKKWDVNDEIVDDFKRNLNFSINESRLINLSQLSETPINHSLCETESIDMSKVSNECSTSTARVTTPRDVTVSVTTPQDVTVGVRSSLRKRKSRSFSEKVPAPLSSLGSLWAQYNDSGSAGDSLIRETASCSTTDHQNEINLFDQSGSIETEYSTEMDAVKKLLISLMDMFKQNGSNGFAGLPALGDWDQTLQSDDDVVKCLFFIRESLLKFQSCNNSVSVKIEKTPCDCDSISETLKHLQKENEDLKEKLTESKALNFAEILEKEEEICDMSIKFEALESQYQELLKTKEDLQAEGGDLKKKLDEMKTEMDKMQSKVLENVRYKNLYSKLLNQMAENEKTLNKKLVLLRQDVMDFELEKRKFLAIIASDKKMKIKMASEIEGFLSQIMSLNEQKRTFRRYIKDLKMQIEKLSSNKNLLANKVEIVKVETVKAEADEAETDEETTDEETTDEEATDDEEEQNKPVSTSNPSQHNMKSRDMVQNIYNINYEGDKNRNIKIVQPQAVRRFSVSAISGAEYRNSSESIHRNTGNETSMSTTSTVFNKSIAHGSLMLFTDDEEGFLNHSSIAEIKKDYDPNGESERLQELKRRNTLYLPHMRSAYPLEIQDIGGSPFQKRLYQNMTRPQQVKDVVKNKQSKVPEVKKLQTKKTPSGKHSNKKHKISTKPQHQPRYKAGPSTAITPVMKKRKTPAFRDTFETPASLGRLLQYGRKLRHGLTKPKF